jgi:hypothetical protein
MTSNEAVVKAVNIRQTLIAGNSEAGLPRPKNGGFRYTASSVPQSVLFGTLLISDRDEENKGAFLRACLVKVRVEPF